MKKLFLILVVIAMLATACDTNGGFDDTSQTEQPSDNNNQNGDTDDDDQDGDDNGDEIPIDTTQVIRFQDEYTKWLCISKWDLNSDDELSYDEAAAVTDLGGVFRGTSISSFTELKYFTGVTSIGYETFAGCKRLTRVTIPNSVTSIGYRAFEGCSSLENITIPNSVTSIENYAFSGCSDLINITVPNSVISIEKEAFYGCRYLKSIYCESVTPPTGEFNMFENSPRKIYVPSGSEDAYRSAEAWMYYADYIVGYNF